MKKIFEKHETLCCMLLIVLYVVINSYCMQNFGMADYRSTIINTLFSAYNYYIDFESKDCKILTPIK